MPDNRYLWFARLESSREHGEKAWFHVGLKGGDFNFLYVITHYLEFGVLVEDSFGGGMSSRIAEAYLSIT